MARHGGSQSNAPLRSAHVRSAGRGRALVFTWKKNRKTGEQENVIEPQPWSWWNELTLTTICDLAVENAAKVLESSSLSGLGGRWDRAGQDNRIMS